jgi:hypothetical protein
MTNTRMNTYKKLHSIYAQEILPLLRKHFGIERAYVYQIEENESYQKVKKIFKEALYDTKRILGDDEK